jgi:hypothetical protein
MKKRAVRIYLLVAAAILLLSVGGVVSMQSEDVLRLKNAGVGDETIQAMIEEKTLETAAFTVEDILSLRRAGVGDRTLQMLIRSESFLRQRRPVVYGTGVRSIRFTTAEDIIALKEAGLSDRVLQAIIEASGDGEELTRKRALRLLEDMNIRVDFRDEF